MHNIQSSYRHFRAKGFRASSALERARTDSQSRYVSKPRQFGAFGRDPKRKTFYVEKEVAKTMRTRYADEIASMRHTGWFTDECESGTLRGVVVQIPAHNGESRYLAGYEESDNGGLVIERDTVWTDETGAAHRADQLAERGAEESREHDRAYRAGTLYADNLEATGHIRKQALAVLKARKAVSDPDERRLLAETVQDHLDDIARLRSENETLRSGDYDGCSFYTSDDLMSTFYDAAGIDD